MKRQVLLALTMAIVMAFAFSACGGGEEAATEPSVAAESAPAATEAAADTDASSESQPEVTSEPIQIGVASAQTGFFSFYDQPIATAIQLAVDDLNEQGGVLGRPLEVIVSDTKSDTNLSGQAAAEVLDQGADFVITMCDYDLGAPAAREAGNRDVIAYSCAGSPLFGPKGIGPLAFSVSEGTATQGATGAEFALEQGWKTAYLFRDVGTEYSKSWCDNFAEVFQAQGGEIVGEDTFQPTDETVAPQVSRLKTTSPPPDVIAMCSFPPIGATAIRQIRAAGIDTPIVGTAGFDGPFWLEAIPDVSEVYVPATASLFGDDPNPKVQELVDAYTEATGAPPDTAYFLYGYAMTEAIAKAVERAGTTDGPAVADQLNQFSDEELVIGPTTYTEICHQSLGRPMRIIQYQNGEGSLKEEFAAQHVVTPPECQ
jgi:branched-chain amino acid transport system substrate-binding protein